MYADTLKSRRSRTVPLPAELHPLIDRLVANRPATEWLFVAPSGGPLRESNWKRTVRWPQSVAALGYPTLRVHDLRHTAASLWLASGADPKVVQAVLGHASAAMTMDIYGHLIATNLWDAVGWVGGCGCKGRCWRVGAVASCLPTRSRAGALARSRCLPSCIR